jgi:NAD+ kinase
MAATFQKFGLIGKYGDPDVGETLLRLSRFLLAHQCEVFIEEGSTSSLPAEHALPVLSLDAIGEQCDLAITVGGDGTLLNAARSLVDHNVPILGINQGRLGFLVDVSPHEMEQRMAEILDGKFEEEHRIMLSASIERAEDVEPLISDAFNDVVVHKWEVARMIETETYINGKLLNTMRSDGLIVATPTGSTAYALSGGGPIVEPDMDATILVPICPHTMSYRPIVIDGDSEIEIIVRDYPHSHAQVTCDGQINMGLLSGDKVRIRRKQRLVRLIHPCQHDHYHILRAKLHWGEHF